MGISDDIKPRRVRHLLPKKKGEAVSDSVGLEKTNDHSVKTEKDNPKPVFFDEIPEKPKKGKNRHIFIKVLAWLAVLGAIVFAFSKSPYNPLNETAKDKQSSNSQSESSYEGESVTQDQSESNASQISAPSGSDTGATSSISADTVPAASKTDGTIKVLNGSGVSKVASAVKTELTNAGFNVASTGNAKNFNYLNTIIYSKSDKEAFANLVKDALSSKNPTIEKSDSITAGYTVVVVIGKN